MTKEQIKAEILQEFGNAYRGFGLSKLMGRVVALLLFSNEPLSLDEISIQLEMSKGPISQITRRLMERNLIKKIWMPGSRKDYYEVMPEIFEHAFRNSMDMVFKNTVIAGKLKSTVQKSHDGNLEHLEKRLTEMELFYEIMEKHYRRLLDEWIEAREELYSK